MSKKSKLTRWYVFDYLDNEESIDEFLKVVIDENDPNEIIFTLGIVAKARGINKMAEELGIDRQLLYKDPYEETKPDYAVISRVINKLGIYSNIKAYEG